MTIWSWPAIVELVRELCDDLLTDEQIEALRFNARQGPEDRRTCLEMADRFEAWLDENREGCTLESSVIRVDAQGRLLSREELLYRPDLETRSPYYADDEQLRRWTRFLRHCGGFAVW